MQNLQIKTIDIQGKQWFDKVNGYGDAYVYAAADKLTKLDYIPPVNALWSYCSDNGIILRTHKKTGCKKRELAK